jgi:hypothetical protein
MVRRTNNISADAHRKYAEECNSKDFYSRDIIFEQYDQRNLNFKFLHKDRASLSHFNTDNTVMYQLLGPAIE